MKKTLILGAVSAALAALPVVACFAEVVDIVSVTVNPSCTIARLAYGSDGTGEEGSHKNGTGTIAGTWGSANSTLTVTMSNGTTTPTNAPLGTSRFNVTCNDPDGYRVSVTTTDLTVDGTDLTIPASTTYSATTSGWGVIYNGAIYASTEGTTLVNAAGVTTGGTAYEVGYGVGISSNQAAGTYTGTATYTVAGI